MEIIQEIGSYAGLAAVLGLAVLSALYFSQARDVKRLREWAGRAPERTEATQPPQVVAKPVPKPPVPVAPGKQAAPGTQAAPTMPGAVPKPAAPATAAAAAAGAAPAVATGPPAATPAAARAAGEAGTEAPAEAQDGANGTDEHGVVSQDTVIHPPPAPPEGDEEEEADEAAPPGDDADEGDAAEADAGDEDADEEEEGEPGVDADDEDAEPAPEDYHEDFDEDAEDDEGDQGEDVEDEDFEDTGDEPAVAAPAPPRRPTIPIGAGTSRADEERPSGAPILPPYSQSRPGGPSAAKNGAPGIFSSPGRAVAIVGGGLLAVAAIGFGVLQLTGGDDEGTDTPASNQAATPAGGEEQEETPKKKKAAGIDPGSVRVAVLNGTTVPGLAAQIGDSIERQGFQLGTVTNFIDQQRAESVVKYAPGAEREAADVGRRLKISQREPIDAESQGLAGDATVVVVAGADKTQ